MWQKYGYKKITLFVGALFAIFWFASSDKPKDVRSTSSPSAREDQKTTEYSGHDQATSEKYPSSEASKYGVSSDGLREMLAAYLNASSSENAHVPWHWSVAYTSDTPPALVVDTPDLRSIDYNPQLTCMAFSKFVDPSVLQDYGFRQFIVGIPHANVVCDISNNRFYPRP